MKRGAVIFLTAAAFLMSGCQREDMEARENAAETLEQLFETASEEEYSELAEPVSTNGNEQAESVEMPEWMHERFDSCVSDVGYRELWTEGLLMIPVYAYEAGEKLELMDVEVQGQKQQYEFHGTVEITKEQEKSTVEISGTVQIDEEGKVAGLQFSDSGTLMGKIAEGGPEN